MKRKYTKAKVEIIPLKTEGFICTTPDSGTGKHEESGDGVTNPKEEGGGFEHAKAFDGNGINDFSFDSIPPTKK